MRNKQRRHHTKEFKEEAVKLVSEQGYMLSPAVFWAAGSGKWTEMVIQGLSAG